VSGWFGRHRGLGWFGPWLKVVEGGGGGGGSRKKEPWVSFVGIGRWMGGIDEGRGGRLVVMR